MPRGRALALASAYVAGIAVMFGVLGTVFALAGQASSAPSWATPGSSFPLALFFVAMGLSMFGAFELALPAGLQARLSRVGGRGFGGAFLMGLVGGIIAAPCTGPPLAGPAGLRDHHPRRRVGVRHAARPTASASACRSGCWRRSRCRCPDPGAWMEWIKSFFGILLFLAALYYLKNVVPALGHFTSPSPAVRDRDGGDDRRGRRAGRHSRDFHGGVTEQLRKGLGVGLVTIGLLGLDQLPADAQGRRSSSPGSPTRPRRSRTRAPRGARCWSTSPPTGARRARSWTSRSSREREVAEVMTKFTLLRVDMSNANDVPALGELSRSYDAETLPAVRVVSPEGEDPRQARRRRPAATPIGSARSSSLRCRRTERQRRSLTHRASPRSD